jgi:mRNA-degrading endonuclease RelE of RelBE toxin-antitoxin system
LAYKWLPQFTESFREDIDALDSPARMLVFQKVIQLLNADDPTNPNEVTDIKRLKSPEYRGLWRKRAGDWRILYSIEPGEITHLNVAYQGKVLFAAVVFRRDL